MIKQLFVGVDGGASKCVVRIEDEHGAALGQATSGPANIRLSVEQAWQSINTGLKAALFDAGFSADIVAATLSVPEQAQKLHLHVGMGLAGCEIERAKQAFAETPHAFAALKVTSDAHVACLGAHSGQDGAIVIVGTGTVGFKCNQSTIRKVGGWGFPHDDVGSGAWLGLETVKVALQTRDGRLPPSAFSKAINAHFHDDDERLVAWANAANSTQFAELAPITIQLAEQGDPIAVALMQCAAHEVECVINALGTDLPCALIGGIAPHLLPYLSAPIREIIKPAQETPEEGAIQYIKQQ